MEGTRDRAPSRGRSSGGEHFTGFDTLRLLAAAGVFFQHACALTDHEGWSSLAGGLRTGRLGTAVFLGLSGYLAAATSRSPEAWLGQRARKLVPAYWVVMAVGFTAAGLTGYKPFDGWQVFCQMTGVGLFTHHDRMVNVVTWFVPLLGALYLLAYLARRTDQVAVIGVALAVAVAGGLGAPGHVADIACNAGTFLAAYLAALAGGRPARWFAAGAGAAALLTLVQPGFRYGLCALTLLALATAWQPPAWRFGRFFGRYSYEWFLAHGLCLHAACFAAGKHLGLVLPLGAVLSLAAAVVLQKAVGGAGSRLAHGFRALELPAAAERFNRWRGGGLGCRTGRSASP